MEMSFENMEKMDDFSLETDEGEKNNFTKADILLAINEMLEFEDAFVILTAPKAIRKIRYIQSTVVGDDEEEILLQIAVEEDRTRLFEKICTEDELKDIFLQFYDGKFDPDMSKYEPVKFK